MSSKDPAKFADSSQRNVDVESAEPAPKGVIGGLQRLPLDDEGQQVSENRHAGSRSAL